MKPSLRQSANFLAGLDFPTGVDISFGETRAARPDYPWQINSNESLGMLQDQNELLRLLSLEKLVPNADVFGGDRFFTGNNVNKAVLATHQFPIFDFNTLSPVESYEVNKYTRYTTRIQDRHVMTVTYSPWLEEEVEVIPGLKLGKKLFQNCRFASESPVVLECMPQINADLARIFKMTGLDIATVRFAVQPSGSFASIISVEANRLAQDAMNKIRFALPYILASKYGLEV